MADTIFSKIIAGQIPCTKVYEDDKTFAFLDINPINKGHALVVSKAVYSSIHDIPDDVISAVAVASKKVAAAVTKATKAEGVNILQNNGKAAGQEVFHYHVHVIPRFSNDGFRFNWQTEKYGDGEAAAMGESIRAALL